MGDSKKHINTRSSATSVPEGSKDGRAPASRVHLHYNPDSRRVLAQLISDPEASVLSVEQLHRQLAEEGYGDYLVADEALKSVVQKANGAESGEYAIAECRAASCDWSINDDKTAVYLTLTPAYGGATPSRESLRAALLAQQVPQECILPGALEEAVAKGQCQNLCVAQARPAKPGRNARFEPLVDTGFELQLQEDEQGRVDLRELHEFVVVEPGAELMRRHPATAGTPGLNVAGEPLNPTPGKDVGFSKDLPGTAISPNDSNLLIAAIKGHPVLVPQGIRIDPTLKVNNVDLSTGNIDFDGSLEVTGNVSSGFVVRATGDIVIHGMVEKAEVYARQNLTVGGGVIGEEVGRDEDGHLRLRTQLRAGGNLSAKFVNLAELVAGGDIQVQEYVMQSHLHSQGAILVGQQGGKGSLIGGRAIAAERLVANILGSGANVYTEVRIGTANPKRRLMENLKKAVALCDHNCQKLETALAAIEQSDTSGSGSGQMAKIHNTLKAQRQRRQRLQSLIQRLVARRQASRTAQVDVRRQLHANVHVAIDGVGHTYTHDLGPRCLVRRGAELVTKT